MGGVHESLVLVEESSKCFTSGWKCYVYLLGGYQKVANLQGLNHLKIINSANTIELIRARALVWWSIIWCEELCCLFERLTMKKKRTGLPILKKQNDLINERIKELDILLPAFCSPSRTRSLSASRCNN